MRALCLIGLHAIAWDSVDPDAEWQRGHCTRPGCGFVKERDL